MNDKELLELAAKAAGIDYIKDCIWVENGFYSPLAKHERISWNPLTDDGDALRLAVNLGLVVEIGYAHRGFVAVRTNTDNWKEFREPYGKCGYAATRRAIVRAAASCRHVRGAGPMNTTNEENNNA